MSSTNKQIAMQVTLDQIKSLAPFKAIVALGYAFTSSRVQVSRLSLAFTSPKVAAGDGGYVVYTNGVTRFTPTRRGMYGNMSQTKVREAAPLLTLADWFKALQHVANAIPKRRAKLARAIETAPARLAAAQKWAEKENARRATERVLQAQIDVVQHTLNTPRVTVAGQPNPQLANTAFNQLQVSPDGVIESTPSELYISLTMELKGDRIQDVVKQLESIVSGLKVAQDFTGLLPLKGFIQINNSTVRYTVQENKK